MFLATGSDMGTFLHHILFPDGSAKASLTPVIAPVNIQNSYFPKVTDKMLKVVQCGG